MDTGAKQSQRQGRFVLNGSFDAACMKEYSMCKIVINEKGQKKTKNSNHCR